MKRAIAFFLAVFSGLFVGVPTLAQDDNVPPVIVSETWVILRNVGGDPLFGPYTGPFPFDPLTENANELDILFATAEIFDPDFTDEMGGAGNDEVFVRQQTVWFPFNTYLVPELPPVMEDTDEFLPEEGDGFSPVSGNTVFVVFRLTVPEFKGKNQARLRGLIDWDIRFAVLHDVSNEQSPDRAESFTITRTVGNLAGDPFFVSIIHAVENPVLAPPNAPPFADAGPDILVEAGTTIELDASATFDSFNLGFDTSSPNIFEKDKLTFTWEWISGPQRVDPIYRDPINRPAFAEVTLNVIGIYEYRLTADDNVNALPTTDTTSIEVVSLIPKNRAPVARIVGPTDSSVVGSVIMLDGTSSSDPDGDVLSFRWRQIDELGGNLAESDVLDLFQPLGGVESPISTWQATQAGTFYFRLLVDDGLLIDSKTISLTVVEPGSVVAVTGGDGTGKGLEGGSSAAGDPSDEAVTAPLSVPACGGGLLPLAMLPFALWMGRGRIR